MGWPVLARVAHLVSVLLKHGSIYAYRTWGSRLPGFRRWISSDPIPGPLRFRTMLEELGGSFIKLGQMLALQPDILPAAYCQSLYELLDHVPPVPLKQIRAVFQQDVRREPEQVFDIFEHQPLASGSIGQVHVGWKDGRKYAIKIQRPDTQQTFACDVGLMSALIRTVTFLRLGWLQWMCDPLNEFVKWTRDELDFRREADHMKLLRENSRSNPAEYVPDILVEYCTSRILVVEFLEGVTLLDHIRQRDLATSEAPVASPGRSFNANIFAENIINNFLGDAFSAGAFHADLHPANLIVLDDNCVGYVDFGITGIISQYSRQNLVAMTLAYARKELDTMCDRFFDVSSMNEDSDPDAFREGVKELSENWYKNIHGESRLQITTTTVMMDMLTLSRQTRILPQRDVVLYIRASIAIDGLIRQFAPGFDVAHHLALACRRYLTNQARKMLLSHQNFVNWSRAGTALMHSGLFRMTSLLERISQQKPKPPYGRNQTRQSHRPTIRRRIVVLCLFIVFLFYQLTHSPGEDLGVNLYTAQIATACYAIWSLFQPMRTQGSTDLADL